MKKIVPNTFSVLKRPKNAIAFCYILIDNYDDIMDRLSAGERSTIISHINIHLSEWAKSLDAVVLNYENDHFVMIFDQKYLQQMEKDRFSILDRVREIRYSKENSDEKSQITLSMGIGISADSLSITDADALSHAALDFALARGGDQCVVRNDEKITFYGGKTEASERRTKVKARVKSHALRDSILNASNVLIMGHQMPDMDCIGSAVGIMGACRYLDRDCRFVMKEINYSIRALVDYLSRDPHYLNAFITSSEAGNYLTENTLLIIVDTQNQNYVELPELIESVKHTVVIDHHRRSGKGIEASLFNYLEPYASSTCELVTELLQYIEDDGSPRKSERSAISKTESNALLAGICMDTKMFTLKTGVRTFEAASYLKRKGADTIIAKALLQNDLETYAAKSDAVRNAKIYYPKTLAAQQHAASSTYGNIAISSFEDSSPNAKIIAAQAADELLNIRGIGASFIILKYTDCMIISGRSMGDINVQLILEKLGGGGHLTMAGAQLYEVSDLKTAEALLIDAIESFYSEEELSS